MSNDTVKNLNKFAIPLLLQTVSSYFIGATDVAIVGQISVEAMNASSLISSTLEMVGGILGAITITLNILLGKNLGKKDKSGFSFEFYSSILLSCIIGIIFSSLIFLFGKNILQILFNLDRVTTIEAIRYLKPMSLYVLLQLIIFAYTSTCKVLNKTKYILYISVLSSIIDVALDYVFVLGNFGLPKMGIGFAGFSTILSMVLSITAYSYILRGQVKFDSGRLKEYLKNILNHFKLSTVFILQEILDGSVYGLFVNMILVRLGKTDYAGYVIISTIIGLLFVFKYVYGSAVLSIISIESGASNKKNMIKYPKYSSFLTLSFYLSSAILIIIFNKNIISLFSNNGEAVIIAEKYILQFILIYSVSCISYPYKMGLQAINQSKFVLYTSMVLDVFAILLMFATIILLKLSFAGLIVTIFMIELFSLIIFTGKYKHEINHKTMTVKQ